MAACGPCSLGYLSILLLCLTQSCVSSAKYLSVYREKQHEPFLLTVGEDDSRESLSPSSAHHHHLSRAKRHADEPPGQSAFEAFPMNDSHQQVMIQWAGEGSKVIVCVTRDSHQTNTSRSHVFFSYDYGSNYQNHTHKFTTEKPATIINKFYKNDKYTSRFVFTDVIQQYVHVTKDNGRVVTSHKVSFTPSEVSYHPINPDVLLIHDTKDEQRRLWLSETFGQDWRVVDLYIQSYFWSESTSPPTLYVERREADKFLSSVLSSQDLFREGSLTKKVIEDVEEFEVKDEFLFAVTRSMFRNTISLWTSYQGGPFLPAEFPIGLKHQHYYIADVSEGQVMVCVAHEHLTSTLYVSSVPRSANHHVRFSLSLERIMFFRPSSHWNSTWLSGVADKMFADLHPVEGVRGVFIASQLDADVATNTSKFSLDHITSLISFDQGAQWKPLQPPRVDIDNRPIDCSRKNSCSLHVSQELSHLYPATQTSPILSKKSAPGLIVATGVTGTSLKGHTSLYVSTDAGIKWYQVLRGNFLYTVGDHGGLIVAVRHYREGNETNALYYSTDEGETWNTQQFYQEPLRIYGLMTEPGENTTVFTLFGSKPEKHEWIFIKVNLTSVFKYTCSVNDYKTWSPSDGRSGRMCLLGRKQVYERRIPHANCYNGENYDRPISVENCPCDREDFECDFGFIVQPETQECKQDSEENADPYAIPLMCKPGRFYNRTKGYRRIPGDTCEGGRDYQYSPSITACPVSEEQEFLLVSARQEILRYDIVNPDAGLTPLPIPNLKMVIALDFDIANNCIYWSDVEEKKIHRLCFDGHHDVETLVDKDIRSVEGLAYDWISQNLYFVDGERKTLEVIQTNITNFGRMRRTLLSSPVLDNPRGIALHPLQGYLYITDWSDTSPKVARAYMDGKNLTTLFGEGVVGWPNGITIDFQTEKIYFADAKLDYIASADLDGRNMRKIISDSDKVMQPFALGIYKSILYWDDWQVFKVLQADKHFGWGISPIANFTRKGLVDLKVYGHWSQKGSNGCSNSTCKYLCTGRPNNQVSCLCPDGLQRTTSLSRLNEECRCPDGSAVGSDGTCSSKNNTCASHFFRCDNGRCIPRQWACDKDDDCGDQSDENHCPSSTCFSPNIQCNTGLCIRPDQRCDHNDDCWDGSDEANCTYASCDANQFKCDNGRCIHANWKCDLEDDCRDGSDEANCTRSPEDTNCRTAEIKCANENRCLPASWRCDGDKDCSDGSDEADCDKHNCDSWQFQCDSKQCIFRSWRCDGEKDCEDNSDERNCSAPTLPPSVPPPPLGPLFPPLLGNCTEYMFKCGNLHCIPFWWRCDLLDDCGDNTDEEGCSDSTGHLTTTVKPTQPPKNVCLEDQFACNNGICIWDTWVCDKDLDCRDGEDEENCHQTTTCADQSEFQCKNSQGCIPSTSICDNRRDCADGSDEEWCSMSTVTPANNPCASGYFSCDGGTCMENTKRCNGHTNCIDLSDEQNCTSDSNKQVYSVSQIVVVKVTNISGTVEWQVNDGDNTSASLEYLVSYSKQDRVGNPSSWQNTSWTKSTTYKLTGLDPYTKYVLKIYVRKVNGSEITPPRKSVSFETEIGVPSPPEDVVLEQVRDGVRVTWAPPHHPNGVIVGYRVFMSPAVGLSPIFYPGTLQQILLPSPVLRDINDTLTVWVTVNNDVFMSGDSEHVTLSLESLSTPTQLHVDNINASAVSVGWTTVPRAEGYTITHNRPENEFLLGPVTVVTSNNYTIIPELAPGQTYIVMVEAFKDLVVSEMAPIKVEMPGDSLLPVTSLQASLVKDSGTSIKVSWSEPHYKVTWVYRLLWGKNGNELKHSKHVAHTTNTTFLVWGLDACDTYFLAVMVDGPLGIGPAQQIKISTGADPLAPPKNVQAQLVQNKTLNITWEPSCRLEDNGNITYLLTIQDLVKNSTSVFELLEQKSQVQSHTVETHWGGRYTSWVSSSVPGARSAKVAPSVISGPVIPPPFELTFTALDQTFYWRNNGSLPVDILVKNYSYVLYLAKTKNLEGAEEYECDRPPLKVSHLSPGVVYYAAVALRDAEGYLSPPSHLIRVEKSISNEVVISQGNVVGVAVSVVVVVVGLLVVVAVLAVRHRRLARSFLTFANSHYDRSQGTTLITTDHNLDEDDDSPMIRGFSDDEPLVIA